MPDDHDQLSLLFSPRRKSAASQRKAQPRQTSRGEIARLKVTLQNVRPAIWRRLEVPGSFSFASLHDILQIAFGWTDSHLHQFHAGAMRIGMADGDIDDTSDENQTRLDQILPICDRIVYEYDFGDSWGHLIVVEALQSREEQVAYPRCIGGKRSAPPEDCGGPWGYREFLKAIREPSHEEHESMIEWIGGEFDPEGFSLDETNRHLLRLASHKRWRKS